MLFGRFGFRRPASPGVPAAVLDWQSRVVANGGSVSANTLAAMNTFYAGLASCGLLGKMKFVLCFVPDNLTAAITPLIKANKDICDNTGLIDSDFNVNGLKFRSGLGLKSGFVPATHFGSAASAGCTVYVTDNASTGTECLVGADGGNSSASEYFSVDINNSNHFHACYWGYSTYIDKVYPTGWCGYFSTGRSDAANLYLYHMNSSTSHTVDTLAKDIGTTTLPAVEAYIGIRNSTGLKYGCSKRISFTAMHDAITEVESVSFYNLIQALRISLGGGFI